ncbi:MAG TPA: hypothetical protein VGR04_01150 [Acidimicrobiia bacterium]|jgi:hypothetical protein|nr:hypothetical protein [Acidimicrobiia bacterium]
MRKLGFLLALTTAAAVVGIAPAGAQTQGGQAFCDAALKVDKAFSAVGDRGPTKKQAQDLDKALSGAESTAPPEIAADVQSIAGIIRSAAQSNQDPSENPTFTQNLAAIDQYRYNSCGYQQLQANGIEYEFQGLPKTVPAGKVAIQFTDNGAEIHELEVLRIKGKDSAKKLTGLSESQLGKKAEDVGSTFAMQGQTSYAFADMSKPGRYAVLCHLPVGSTSPQAAEEAGKKHAKSHAQEGMYATITVEGGATTTTAAG